MSIEEDLGFTAEEVLAARGISTPSNAVPESKLPQELAENIIHSSFQANEAIEAAKNSLDFLAAMVLLDAFKYFFPPIYNSIWNWLITYVHKTRDFSQLALGLPRGFAKTTFIKIFLIYVILFTDRKFILICAENQRKADNIVSDIMDMLSSPNIKNLFGDWKLGAEKDTQSLKKFGFRGRNLIIMAGTVGTVRGALLKNERPDVMLFDDIQSREMADSEIESNSLERELVGTAMKAKSPHRCLYIFVANMYPTKHSLLRKIKANPNWIKFIAGGLLQNAKGEIESLWEELQPKEQLLKEFKNDMLSGNAHIFYSEVLNDENAAQNTLIDITALPPCPHSEDTLHNGNFVIIDPSNDKANSDAVAIGYFELIDTVPVLVELISKRLSPMETIRSAITLCLKHGCSIVGIESNAYQYSLHYWFEYMCVQAGITGIQSVELYSGHKRKTSRILDMFKQLRTGEIFYVPETAPHVNSEITSFNPLKDKNVDNVLDLLTYAPKMVTEYGEQIVSSITIIQQEYGEVEVPDFNTPF